MNKPRLRHLAEVNPSTPEFDLLGDEIEVPFVPLEAVWPGDRLDTSRRRTKGSVSTGYTRFRSGDVLVPKITPTFEADRSTIAQDVEGGVAAGTTEIHILRPGLHIDSRYLKYLVSSRQFLLGGKAEMFGVAGQKRVPDNWLRDFRVQVVALARQQAIADFLDAETARIDALVAKKRRLIETVEARFERLILAGIAGDLTAPDEPRRRSNLDWIDAVPASWGTPPVSANFDVQLGKMLNADAAAAAEQATYVRNTNVQWDNVRMDDLATMHFDTSDRRRFALLKGDLLVCEGGEVGRSAVWPGSSEPVFFQKAIHRVRPRQGGNARYLMYCLRAAAQRGVFKVEGNQATIVHLTAEKLRVHRFPWPSPVEQSKIVGLLDGHREVSRAIQEKLTLQIELLLEHRQALITAAVTGEIEVPGAAAA